MEIKSFELKDVEVEERTFTGYAAAYGNVDSDGDIIQMGAFAESLANDFPRNKIKILWQHKSSEPIGLPVEMREDDKGLFVKGKISKTERGNEAMELLRDGVIDSMSVGFMIPKDGYGYDEDGKRMINKGRLMEFSLVTFPANEQAVVQSVKEVSEREIERVLREAGVSRTIAKSIVANGVKGLRDAERDAKELMDLINELKGLI
jgi:HK97 family phage prohead protease